MRQLGGERDIVITTTDIEEGVAKEPPMLTLALTLGDYRGKEIDPIVEHASHKFIDDESFVKSRAFAQFMWRKSINNFEEKCKNLKTDQPGRQDSEIEEEVKASFIEEFA